MAEKKVGKVIYRKALSDMLEFFRIAPEDSTQFPDYKPGQYIALSRDNCRLTKKIPGDHGELRFIYDLDDGGKPKRGSVTHSYSISSAPIETRQKGYLEFYVVLEMIETDKPGRLSESLFHIDPEVDNKIFYMNKITGDFTLDKRAAGFKNVVLVGTGTGLAPFASMIKQLYFETLGGKDPAARYTLFHANRTHAELGYHQELLEIEASGKIDFVYVPSVSRPTPKDYSDMSLGKGRANNILRLMFGMPLKEEQQLREAKEHGDDPSRAENALASCVKPVLPKQHSQKMLVDRMDPAQTVILTCGNPNVMDDIKYIANTNNIRFEKEDW